MTDRYYALTVALEEDIRDDDARAIIQAIAMIRGVLSVKGDVADTALYVAKMRESNRLSEKLWKVLKEDS